MSHNSYSYTDEVNIEALKGLNIVEVRGLEQYSDEVVLFFDNGMKAVFYHMQDCCESVRLEDFNLQGELTGPIYEAYESVSDKGEQDYEHETWTFYRLATMNGTLFMRWVGSSNGYYGEGVDIAYVKMEG